MTIETLEGMLRHYPPETEVKIVYETYAIREIEGVTVEDGIVLIEAENY